jgi:hypothetical protein
MGLDSIYLSNWYMNSYYLVFPESQGLIDKLGSAYHENEFSNLYGHWTIRNGILVVDTLGPFAAKHSKPTRLIHIPWTTPEFRRTIEPHLKNGSPIGRIGLTGAFLSLYSTGEEND